jgi:hypothetical protein
LNANRLPSLEGLLSLMSCSEIHIAIDDVLAPTAAIMTAKVAAKRFILNLSTFRFTNQKPGSAF